MNTNFTRPNFFPGQIIDYRDFNQLAQQSERVFSFLCAHLFEGGGIIVNAMDEFKVTPGDGLNVLIKPGIALLPNGQPCILTRDVALDLRTYQFSGAAQTLHVCLRNTVRGTERFTDPEDPSIQGYRAEALEPDVVISTTDCVDDGVEICQILLPARASSLRLATTEEEWNGVTSSQEDDAAVVDLRNRTYIVPQTYRPTSAEGLLNVRLALYGIERSHRKIVRVFLLEDNFHTMQYLTQLHAEILSLPFQPVKVAFLLSEFASKMSLYFEALSSRVGQQRANFNREIYLQMVELLDKMRVRRAVPRGVPFDALLELANRMNQFVEFSEERFNLLNTVEEALLEMRDRKVELPSRLTLAGHLFEKVDNILTESTDRYRVTAADTHMRNLSTKYRNGDVLAMKGLFLKSGLVSIDLAVPKPDRPLVLVLNQYVRRANSSVRYEINGKPLVSEQPDLPELANSWVNRGLVIPPEALVPQGNRLDIAIEKSDLDFGFFGVTVYQPVVLQGAVT